MLLKKIFKLEEGIDFVNDRRRSKRYDIMLKMNYLDPITLYSGEGLTKNISRNGLRFPMKSKIEKDSILDIKIEDPNSNRMLSLKGRIMWLEEFFAGDDSGALRYETGVALLKKNLFQ